MNPQDLIEKYNSGNLSSEERLEFERLYKSDLLFKEKVLFHEDLKKVAGYEDDLAFKETVKSFEDIHHTSKRNNRIWWVAASFIGILIATYFFSLQQTSHETLFAENFEPYRNVIQPIVRGEQDENLKTEAFVAYENKEYEKAIQSFSELLKSESGTYPTFYLANSYLAVDNTDKAIALFNEYIKTEGAFKDKATWYLALAYLKGEQLGKAIPILEKISDSRSYHHEKATILLHKLK